MIIIIIFGYYDYCCILFILPNAIILFFSEYPEQRCRTDDKGVACGVPGKLKRLQRMVISTQPINALDWNRDHTGLAVATAYDQYLRVIVTTKLNLQ